MHATPGEIKSFKSSAERIADIVTSANAGRAAESLCCGPDQWEEQSVEQICSGCDPIVEVGDVEG